MSRKSFITILVAGLLISACGGAPVSEAPVIEVPAAEAPAPEGMTTASEPEFTSVSMEPISPADANLYESLSSIQPAPASRVALAVSIENIDPAKIPAAPAQPVKSYQVGNERTF